MIKINDIKIGQRLTIFLSIGLIAIFVTFGVFITTKQKAKILEDTQVRMMEQVEDLNSIINNQIIENQQKVTTISKLVFDLFKLNGAVKFYPGQTQTIEGINQITQNKKNFTVKVLEYNGEELYKNYTFVDDIQKKSGATATIFQKIDDGFLRISTNIRNSDDSRATGTYIPNDSPVIKTILNGEIYTGRAFVVNDWYLTSYIPIEIEGSIEGILYVGINEKDMEGLRKIFYDKNYFESGYPFLVDSKGDMIIHPKSEGINIAKNDFFIEMLNQNTNTGVIDYEWEGKEKKLFYSYVESIDAYVAVSIYIDELMGVIRSLRNTIMISVIVALLILIGITQLIVKSITSGLKKGIDFAEKVAIGDLSQTIDLDQKDEVGQLIKALNSMIVKVSEIVSNIIIGSNSIVSASQQVSSTSVQLSEGANEQASSIEELSSTLEEISANIQQNTENANQSEKVSSDANQEIINVASKSAKAVEANKKISGKITVINDIAFQTNLLALNAAVEAARAGEHGKGFAVVAAEVRKLAENSKVAAEEIVQLAKTGLQISEEAGTVMQGIIPKVENTSKLTQEIAAASNEQNNGVNQVNDAIQQLNSVTQQNASASEELAASAEELNSQAEQLKEVIVFFKVAGKKVVENGLMSEHTINKKAKPVEKETIPVKKETEPTEIKDNIDNLLKSNDSDLDSDFENF